ncbi:MAG: hypothetical protein RLZZ519_3009 [Bacteroidota bacterium]|jgi:hypothetical protein
MWVSIANVTRVGQYIVRVNEPPLMEETDRTMICDFLKIKGIWGNPIPATFYEIEQGSSNALDIYFEHYHQLLDFAKEFAADQEHFAQILERVAVDWFMNAERKAPQDVDINTLTFACLEWLRSHPAPAVAKLDVNLEGWQIRLDLDWVALGQIGLVNLEFVERLSEVEQ